MTEELKNHLPTIALVFLVGIAATVYALMRLHGMAADMDAGSFALAVFVIPCVAMVICSFVIMLTASAIGRQLFLVVVGVCFVTGIVGMVVTSGWFSDASVVQALLANTPDATEVPVPLNNPITVMRDIAGFIVAPTVGSIAGAWLGSRLHPMTR